uniref:Putative homing endonuclease n=1 Tax=viral metagenome TaxID=1070528 RepID=A0A6H1ZLU7_9ZZZZ
MNKITKDRIIELLRYDHRTGDLYWKIDRGNKISPGDLAGCINANGYRHIRIDGTLYLSHRLVWMLHHGEFPKYETDHINRNRTDNRIENLRDVKKFNNQRNAGTRADSVSGTRGVKWFAPTKKWTACIRFGGKQKNLGYYKDFCDAVLARLAAEQCIGWLGCDITSPAYLYARKHGLIA